MAKVSKNLRLDRHPKRCKWDKSDRGCRRGSECLYLHETNGNKTDKDKSSEVNNYQCQGCKYIWNERNCMEEHMIQDTRVFFCLNCNDWIKDKSTVFEAGWTMFDEAGFLRTDVFRKNLQNLQMETRLEN